MPRLFLTEGVAPNSSFPIYSDDYRLTVGRGIATEDGQSVDIWFDKDLDPIIRERLERLIEDDRLEANYQAGVELPLLAGGVQAFDGALYIHDPLGPS